MLPYTVRLYFAELTDAKPGERVFSIGLQGKEVLSNLDVVKAAGGKMRGLVKEFRAVEIGRELELSFAAGSGLPVISGVELILEPQKSIGSNYESQTIPQGRLVSSGSLLLCESSAGI